MNSTTTTENNNNENGHHLNGVVVGSINSDHVLKKKVEYIIDLLTNYLEQPFGQHGTEDHDHQKMEEEKNKQEEQTKQPEPIKEDERGTDHIRININETSSYHQDADSVNSNAANDRYSIFFKPIYPGSTNTLQDISSIASRLSQNEPINQLIIKKIVSNGFAKNKNELLCQWFYSWFNLDSVACKRYVLSFLPAMVWVYVYSKQSDVVALEACLMTVYNHELLRRDDRERMFQAPSVSHPSYIHRSDDVVSTSLGLTESALKQLQSLGSAVVVDKPLPRIDAVTTANRAILLRTVVSVYTAHIVYYPHVSRVIFCEMATRMAATGFPFLPPQQDAPPSPDNDGGRGSFSSASNFRMDSDGEGSGGNTAGGSSLLRDTIRRNSMLRSSNDHLDPMLGGSAGGTRDDALEKMWMDKEREKKMEHFNCMTTFLEPEYIDPSSHSALNLPSIRSNGHSSTTHTDILNINKLLTQQTLKRIFVDDRTYQEIVSGLCFCAFQDATKSMAWIAIKAVNDRSSYDLVPEVMLSTNSILHILQSTKRNYNLPSSSNQSNQSSLPLPSTDINNNTSTTNITTTIDINITTTTTTTSTN